jgi:hypothetical protein
MNQLRFAACERKNLEFARWILSETPRTAGHFRFTSAINFVHVEQSSQGILVAACCSRFAVRSAALRCLRRPRRASHRDAATTDKGLAGPQAGSMTRRLHREIKSALVQPRVANHLPTHTGPEHGFEHVLLEPANDRVTIH